MCVCWSGFGFHLKFFFYVWRAIDKLLIIWKSDLTDKTQFLPGSCRIDTAVWMHYLDANKIAGEKSRQQLHKNAASNIEQVLEATAHKASTIWPPASHHENYPSQTIQTCRTLLEKQGRAHKWCTPMDPHIWPSKSRTTIHTAGWTYIQQLCEDTGCNPENLPEVMNDRRSGERGSGISVLAARHHTIQFR